MTIEEFAGRIILAWAADTSYTPEQWTQQNPAQGQCLVTAMVAGDVFGGAIVKGTVNGVEHYWNYIEGGVGFKLEIDFTRTQFGSGPHSVEVHACSESAFTARFPGLRVLTVTEICKTTNLVDLHRRYTTLSDRFACQAVYPKFPRNVMELLQPEPAPSLLIPRKDCNCSCHFNKAIVHITACCRGDLSDLALDSVALDAVTHSAQFFDTDRNKPIRCCENDDNGDGNCWVHSAPGVFRKQGLRQ